MANDIIGSVNNGSGRGTNSFAVNDPRRLDRSNAGAGRGGQGGPTAAQLTANGAPRSAQQLNGGDLQQGPPPNIHSVVTRNGKTDLRTKIIVPSDYLTPLTSGWADALKNIRGIIFPYTPTITTEHKAEYNQLNPLHSNYSINFYKHSAVGDITISGTFSVQNASDAVNYLSTVHLLRALTKGRFGGSDPLRGSPPPVCRLYAYGTFMLQNVPVAITSFRNDLNADVDYYYLSDNILGESYVPVKSTIQIICKPMYSRKEMLDAPVQYWLGDSRQRSSGLL
jgi:hypothetical protein